MHKFTAEQLYQRIALRHADAVVVPECKTGPSQGVRHFKLDAWVLLKTWPARAIGYEIKVDRSDWLSDKKFEQYRQYCHALIVVAPKGVVRKEELPHGVGLLEPLGDARLVTRQRAAFNDVVVPQDLLFYIIMSRLSQNRMEHYVPPTRAERIEFFRKQIETAEDASALGLYVKGRIGKEMRALQRRIQSLEHVEGFLKTLNIDPEKEPYHFTVERKIRDAFGLDTLDSLKRIVENAEHSLQQVSSRIDTFRSNIEARSNGNP